MFRRRVPPHLLHRLTGWIWPQRGWRRAILYRAHRIGRIPDSPHKVAAGLASGVAIGLMPLIGIQFFLAALLALLVRGNIFASAVGSFIANPWTLPVIWESSYAIGQWILPGFGSDANTLEFLKAFADLVGAVVVLDFDRLSREVWPIWLPMMIGSLPLAVVGWFLSYWLSRKLIERYQVRRRRKRRRVMERAAPDPLTDVAAFQKPRTGEVHTRR